METFISKINTEAAFNPVTYQRPKFWGKCDEKKKKQGDDNVPQ